jgi:hypothetical protein
MIRQIPMIGNSGTKGTRNGRSMSGSVRRRTITPMLTRRNANSVPMFTSLTISDSGTSAARMAMRMPMPIVSGTGVPVRGFTLAMPRGIRPSRAIAKKMRVCP